MGTHATKAAANMYYKCRVAASKYNDKLKSREGAAELLGLSSSTLASYELGLTKVVPVENVMLMADVYNAPELKHWYCSNVCPLGEDAPKVEVAELDRLTVKMLSVLKKADHIEDDLLDIAADGGIECDEVPTLESIMRTLDEIIAASESMRIWIKKNIKGGD